MKNYSSNMVSPEQFTTQLNEISKDLTDVCVHCDDLAHSTNNLKRLTYITLATSVIALIVSIGVLIVM